MSAKGRVQCVWFPDKGGIQIEVLDGATIPPGYQLGFPIPHPSTLPPYQTSWIDEYEVIPAPGLRAKWLRWRHRS